MADVLINPSESALRGHLAELALEGAGDAYTPWRNARTTGSRSLTVRYVGTGAVDWRNRKPYDPIPRLHLIQTEVLRKNGRVVPAAKAVKMSHGEVGLYGASLIWEAKCYASFREQEDGSWRASDPYVVLPLLEAERNQDSRWRYYSHAIGDRPRLQAWVRRAEGGAAVRPFTVEVDGETIVIQPPVAKRDNDRRLHAEDGPALVWSPDLPKPEWRPEPVYAWHGTRVPDYAITGPVSPQRLQQEFNLETRRVMIERKYGGMGQYITKHLKLTPAHSDETGDLYLLNPRRIWNGSMRADMAFVRVDDPSTGREYWLRVPPETERAKQGVAWGFNIPENLYRPLAEA